MFVGRIALLSLALIACSGTASTDADGADADGGRDDAATIDGGDDAAIADAAGGGAGGPRALGTVSSVSDATCPQTAAAGASCKRITVSGCPDIESESIDAIVAILEPSGTPVGTITHFSGGGGEGLQAAATQQYRAAMFRQVFVGWASAWEQTKSHGVKAAACRPATVLRWIFDEPTIHGGSRMAAFCGEGFSGGSGQLGYALAQYGLGDYLDYVNELSGPPFARIDLGCDGDAPASATVCGVQDTMKLPSMLNGWENIPAPYVCGSTNVPPSEIERWRNDSIAIGGVYDYPKTDVEFFDCTYQATAVSAMAQIYAGLITSTKGYHCYAQSDGCHQEELGSGNADSAKAMIAGCKPRH